MIKRRLLPTALALALTAAGLTLATPAASVEPQLFAPPAATAADTPTVGFTALKGRPGKAGKSTERRFTTSYFYNVGYQTVNNTGAAATLGVYAPAVDSGDHSLAEIAVRGGTNQGDVVEVGWRKVNGTNTQLFVFNWTAGTPGCYNGCGYVDYAPNTTTYAGMDASAYVGTNRQFHIQHSGGAWWLAFDGQWLGYFPDSDWSGSTFTSATETQFYGEVAAPSSTTPCTDMGNGTLATYPPVAGGVISTAKYYNTSGTLTNSNLTQVESPSVPSQYNLATVGAQTFTYGGPGFC